MLAEFDARGEHRKRTAASIPCRRRPAFSERQRKTAVRLANAGKKTRPIPEEFMNPPDGYAETTQVIGEIRSLAEASEANDPRRMANAIYPYEVEAPLVRPFRRSTNGSTSSSTAWNERPNQLPRQDRRRHQWAAR